MVVALIVVGTEPLISQVMSANNLNAQALVNYTGKFTPPDFALVKTDNQKVSLSDFRGKVVLVNFWASWCLPCIEEMPSVKRLAQAMRDKPFAVIGVNVGEGKRRVQATAKRLQIDFPVLLDSDSSVFEGWGANLLPTAYVLDRSGRVRHIARGPMEWDRADLIEMLVQLAEERPQAE